MKRRDLAQRLLEVVRGDVGELLELGVGALEVVAGGGERLELRDDAAAHGVDVGAELDHLARAARLDAGGSKSPRATPRTSLGEPAQRTTTTPPQDAAAASTATKQASAEGDEDRGHESRGARRSRARRRGARRRRRRSSRPSRARTRSNSALPRRLVGR